MKLKIRGLVFTGFAAAVFASSAMAGITPPSFQDPAHPDSLKKTVTSQDYVDENFQERLQGNASDMHLTESGGSVTEKAAFIGWNYGQGGENKEWVKLEGQNQLDSSNAYVEIVHDTKTSDKKHYVKMGDEALATTAAMITAGGEGTSGNAATALEQGRLTTARAVYDFVTAEVTNVASTGITGNTTYHTQKVAVFENGYTPTGSTTNPSTADLDHVDHWELIVPDSVVAESGSDIAGSLNTGPDAGEGSDFTTAQAVYDFVTEYSGDTYQPKATADYANGGLSTAANQVAQVGVRTGSGTTQDPYVSTWYGLAAGQDGQLVVNAVDDQPYTRVYRETRTTGGYGSGVYVDLDHSRVAVASTYTGEENYVEGIAGVTNYFDASGMALATAGAVKEYVDSMTGGNTLPTMDSACEAAGVHCALVTNYVAASGTQGDSNYVPAHTTLEWTVMAQGQ